MSQADTEKNAQAAAPAAKKLSAPQKALRKLGLTRPMDLALHLPLRYEDETRLVGLAEAAHSTVGKSLQFEAQVVHQEVVFRGRRQLLVTVADGDMRCLLRFFNFYPSQQKQMAVGARLRIRGELQGGLGGLAMAHPRVQAAGGDLPQALTPVYPTTAGLPQAYLRKAILGALQQLDLSETVAPECLQAAPDLQHWSLREALVFLHQPAPGVALAQIEDHSHPAWQRLKAEELLAQQLSQQRARAARRQLRAPVLQARHDPKQQLAQQLRAILPFELTTAQARVSAEIAQDLLCPQPMHRLLQGDVGSGKTVVAALAACMAIEAGWQCALMAPTEILAEQHFARLADWLAPLLQTRGLQVAWLSGSQKRAERQTMLQGIATGHAGLIIGTHAIIQEQVQFARLGLAIIDEQHRFGVEQRLVLRQKNRTHGLQPHLLMMTATPIPRTLAMSYYADLDVSTIDELPPGRTPVVTRLVSQARRDELMQRARQWVERGGRQLYWVCPLIEESQALDLSNATATHATLSAALAGHEVGLLHSRMPATEKKAIMDAFARGDLAALVATTVIEVGVDVPNASLMVIDQAERFGLSQLHQLRGRVGRGRTASFCVLLYGTGEKGRLSDAARARLKAMRQTHDGFEIARRDLEIRGPGEFLGARQSGAAWLRFADLSQDQAWLDWARQSAALMLQEYPVLTQRHIERWLGARQDFLNA